MGEIVHRLTQDPRVARRLHHRGLLHHDACAVRTRESGGWSREGNNHHVRGGSGGVGWGRESKKYKNYITPPPPPPAVAVAAVAAASSPTLVTAPALLLQTVGLRQVRNPQPCQPSLLSRVVCIIIASHACAPLWSVNHVPGKAPSTHVGRWVTAVVHAGGPVNIAGHACDVTGGARRDISATSAARRRIAGSARAEWTDKHGRSTQRGEN